MEVTRRGALAVLGALALRARAAEASSVLTKIIPRTGESLPAVGMGTWRTFDVGEDAMLRAQRIEVLRTFFRLGGAVIDSSPMYGSSQAVLGDALRKLGVRPFAADKIWIDGRVEGRRQFETTRSRWNLGRLDLLQVHNLRDFESHLPTLMDLKERGDIRYAGVTSYAGLRYETIEAVMKAWPIDFVQVTYNVLDREAEERLLPLAQDRGIAVIANRPFREGALIDHVRGKPLPAISAELGASGWAQLLLKFVTSHPAVTTAIPATTREDHMAENMMSAYGPIPDAGQRSAILKAVEAL